MITICIIEDLLEIQKRLQSIIESHPEFKPLKLFKNVEDAIVELPELKPKIAITDINLPRKSGKYYRK